jgi:hypothetical protein
MLVLEFGADGVDAQAEEAARCEATLRGANMLVRGRAVAVLEDLDPDHDRVRRFVSAARASRLRRAAAATGRSRT